ncbi:MAG: FkbM family methyltransferase [Xanthomonadales bacterium]|nr:FkbM family methyltransferase [Xanthomonadales bacterium]
MTQNYPTASQADIKLAYQLVLGREADAEGLRYFGAMAESQGLSAHSIAQMLIGSDEFKQKGGVSDDPVEIVRDGYSVFVRSSDRDIGNAIGKGVSYEPHVSALLKRQLTLGDTFLDVGANIGYFTMMAAKLVGPQGRVIAIEPMDKNLQLIYLGIEKNRFKNVEVFPFGASEHAGVVAIITDPGTSNALVQSAPSRHLPSLRAPTRTIDSMCAGLDRVDFMKIDIEGHEVFAWRGAKEMFSRCKPKIATEFHPHAMRENAGIDCREYVEMMFNYSSEIQIIQTVEKTVSCSSYEQVMEQWRESDNRHGGTGTSHLDLFLLPKR